MKKLLFIAIFAIGFTGCQKHEISEDDDKLWTRYDYFTRIRIVEIEGHDYIILNGYSSEIIHAESCKCKSR